MVTQNYEETVNIDPRTQSSETFRIFEAFAEFSFFQVNNTCVPSLDGHVNPVPSVAAHIP